MRPLDSRSGQGTAAMSLAEAKARVRAWGDEAQAAHDSAVARLEARARRLTPLAAALAAGAGLIAGKGALLGRVSRRRRNQPDPAMPSGDNRRRPRLAPTIMTAVRLAPTLLRVVKPWLKR